jgi:ABC-2 type transport system permease protein
MMLWQQIQAEFLKLWRIPAFSAPTILFPLLLFLLFGLPVAVGAPETDVAVGRFLLASFAAYGLLGVIFFSFGVGVASERGQGWGKLMRATPLSPWVFFLAKLVMGLIFACLILALLFPTAALAAGVRMAPGRWLALFGSLVLGVLPLTTAGFALGYWAGPNSAAPIANLVYLPLAYASGLWLPVNQLPAIVQELTPYLPTYHYGAIARAAVGADDGRLWLHWVWLLGTGLVFGALAIWGYQRDQGRRYG